MNYPLGRVLETRLGRLKRRLDALDRSIGPDLRIDHLGPGGPHQLEESDRRHVPDPLVLAFAVVAGDPGTELGLGPLDRGEGALGNQLGADGRVQPLELAGGGRRVRGGGMCG